MTAWEKLPAVDDGGAACLTCGCGAHTTLRMDKWIAVGFGDAGFSRNGVRTSTEPFRETDGMVRVAVVEALASAAPDHDWRVYFDAPLYSAEYQRQGLGHWVLVAKGMGFA